MFGEKIPFVNLNMQVVGFVFLALVLIAGILDWDDVIGAKGAWNVFIWYGAFYGIAGSLADAGFYNWLADKWCVIVISKSDAVDLIDKAEANAQQEHAKVV